MKIMGTCTFPTTQNVLMNICTCREEAPVTINGGYEMPSWFDIRSLDKNDGNEDEAGVKKASQLITKMIEEEVMLS